ncbi:MAG: hypothetical protein WD768_09725, partial [Phycisphaeraceae bacterium]
MTATANAQSTVRSPSLPAPQKPVSPRTWQGTDIAAAFAAAVEGNEPIFVPASIFSDDRGWSIMNQMQGVMNTQGQINYSVMYPNVVKAWHRHAKQTDFWMGLNGNMKAGVYRSWRPKPLTMLVRATASLI